MAHHTRASLQKKSAEKASVRICNRRWDWWIVVRGNQAFVRFKKITPRTEVKANILPFLGQWEAHRRITACKQILLTHSLLPSQNGTRKAGWIGSARMFASQIELEIFHFYFSQTSARKCKSQAGNSHVMIEQFSYRAKTFRASEIDITWHSGVVGTED